MNPHRKVGNIYKTDHAHQQNVYGNVVLVDGQIDEVKHPQEYHLFNNTFYVVDGPGYAFLVHGLGPAVGDHGCEVNCSCDEERG